MSSRLNIYERAQVYINESGLYSLILKSKKEEAKTVKTWVMLAGGLASRLTICSQHAHDMLTTCLQHGPLGLI